MNTDRLAEIERHWRDMAHLDDPRAEYVLALVEIARVAEEREHREHGRWCGCSLGRALARLDRSSSDGTADSGAAEENT